MGKELKRLGGTLKFGDPEAVTRKWVSNIRKVTDTDPSNSICDRILELENQVFMYQRKVSRLERKLRKKRKLIEALLMRIDEDPYILGCETKRILNETN